MTTRYSEGAAAEMIQREALACYQAGRLADAEKLYRQALALRPDLADMHASLALVLFRQGRTSDAILAFRRALEIAPDSIDTLYKLGNLLLREGPSDAIGDATHINVSRIDECFSYFSRHARLSFAVGDGVRSGVMPHRQRHDQEQQEYLGRTYGLREWKFHLADGGRIASAAVNPVNVRAAVEQWNTARPQIIVIDDLLTEEALAKLRLYCWGSTIWRVTHPEGYLTAMPEHGLACPLIAQIDEEMRALYPGILGAHLLRFLWGFKYDSKLRGVGAHADPSLVTFNFWITPDEANLDPERGGITVWDVAAPADWKQAQYIGDTAACQAYVARSGAKPVTIPYRSNRAIVFASHLFHETDHMQFKEGYLNRRISITMLYGRR